jgi:hypothetical protein
MGTKGKRHAESRNALIRDMILDGKSNAEIYAGLGDRMTPSVAQAVSQQRRSLGRRDPAPLVGARITLPTSMLRSLDAAAMARGDHEPLAAQRLARRLIVTILRDNMIDAVLDDGGVSGATAPQGQGVSSRPPADRPSVPAAPHGACETQK